MPIDSNYLDHSPTIDFSADLSPEAPLSTEHNLEPTHEKAIDKVVISPDWILGVLLLIFTLLAWVRVYHLKRLNQLYQAFLYKLHVYTILRSSDSLITRISVGLNAIFVLSMSLFLYQVIHFYGVEIPYTDTVSPFLIILGIVLIVYPLKSLGLLLIGWVFNDSEKFKEYIFNVFLINKILGLSLIPIVVLVAYITSGHAILLKLGATMVIMFYIYRLFRGYSIGRAAANLSQFYIFLYLCTLEILPLIVITRYISNELGG